MNRRLRLLFVVDSLAGKAGTENQIIELIQGFDPRRFELFLACFEDHPRMRALSPYASLLLYPMESVFSRNGLRQVRRMRAEIRKREIDVVLSFMSRSSIFAVLAGRGLAKANVTCRRNMGYWYTPFYRSLFRFLNCFTTRILVNSEGAKRAAMQNEGLREDRLDLLYNGVDANRFDPHHDPQFARKFGIGPDAAVVGIVANYRAVKNLPFFLRAACRIAAEVPEALFLLVGRGPLEQELRSLAATLGLSEKVIFTDDQDDIAGLLACFHVACLTSDSEGFSNAILEYMAAGLAVVCTNVGGAAEAVEDGRSGYLVAPGDERAFADAVVALLRDDSLRDEFGRRGRQRCLESFTIENSIRQLERYCERLVKNDTPA